MPTFKVAPSTASSSINHPIRVPATLPLTAIAALLLAPPAARAADIGLSASPPGGPPPAPSSWADTSQLAFVTQKLSEWKVMLGGGALIAPKYEGSDAYEVSPVPLVSATFGDLLKVDTRGAAVKLYSVEGLTLTGRVGYDLGRQQDDSDRLQGLGDIGAGAVVGARLAYAMGPVEFYGAVNQIIGGSDGLEARFGADATFRYDRFLFTGGVSGIWANDKYMQAYFGVTPMQSLTSGLPVYDAGSGLKRIEATGSITYMMTDHWLIRGQIGLGYLMGDAAESPIVQSRTQPSGMLAVGYRF